MSYISRKGGSHGNHRQQMRPGLHLFQSILQAGFTCLPDADWSNRRTGLLQRPQVPQRMQEAWLEIHPVLQSLSATN